MTLKRSQASGHVDCMLSGTVRSWLVNVVSERMWRRCGKFALATPRIWPVFHGSLCSGCGFLIRADFREGDEDSNFSVFRVRRFTEWPGALQ